MTRMESVGHGSVRIRPKIAVISDDMDNIIVKDGLVKYRTEGAVYYVKQNFAPSIRVFEAELPPHKRRGIPETFFSNGPVEKLVSLLGLGKCNTVVVYLASDMKLTENERTVLREAVGSDFYFSKDAASYTKDLLPHDDPEIATGFQVILDIIVRNWDDGESNRTVVDGVPVWFDFGASLDPRYQNVYRFMLQLEESRQGGRVSSIVEYFMDYSRRRSQILKRAASAFSTISMNEIRTMINVSKVHIPAYFGEYVVNNIKQISEDTDILRGAFLRENVLRR